MYPPGSRADELRAEAATRSRAGLRRRRESILVSARPIMHTAVAASLAWLVATELLGHDRPFFAPVAAVVTLGLSVGRRRRRALEMAFGVALGILVADLLVYVIGTGTWQIAVVTALAMSAALLLGGGPLLVSQAATSAVLVTTLQPPDGGISLARFLDALAGGASALLVATLLVPVDPAHVVRRSVEPVLDALSQALDSVALALERRDPDVAEEAVVAARAIVLSTPREALAAARDSTRLTLRQGRHRRDVDRYANIVTALELAVNNVRVVARGAARAIALGDATPPQLISALRGLAHAVRALDAGDREDAHRAALDAARDANAVLEQTGNMSAIHMVGQLRSIAVDLMHAVGVEHGEAVSGVREGGPAAGA
jgi:uncharacterized membrane protein YgaE (UPF0421/DUF939 family)